MEPLLGDPAGVVPPNMAANGQSMPPVKQEVFDTPMLSLKYGVSYLTPEVLRSAEKDLTLQTLVRTVKGSIVAEFDRITGVNSDFHS